MISFSCSASFSAPSGTGSGDDTLNLACISARDEGRLCMPIPVPMPPPPPGPRKALAEPILELRLPPRRAKAANTEGLCWRLFAPAPAGMAITSAAGPGGAWAWEEEMGLFRELAVPGELQVPWDMTLPLRPVTPDTRLLCLRPAALAGPETDIRMALDGNPMAEPPCAADSAARAAASCCLRCIWSSCFTSLCSEIANACVANSVNIAASASVFLALRVGSVSSLTPFTAMHRTWGTGNSFRAERTQASGPRTRTGRGRALKADHRPPPLAPLTKPRFMLLLVTKGGG